MNGPEGTVTFVPKQAVAPTPELYDELIADTMEQLAQSSLSFLSPIADGSILHDNGCGTGAATAAIMSAIAGKSVNISIKATDNNGDALNFYQQQATKDSWPAEASNMDSNALDFDDNTFTHSIGNALVFVLANDGKDAIKEAHRTLKSGGTAIFNSWAHVPNMQPLRDAVRATRPQGSPPPRQGMEKWSDGGFLRDLMEQGGFAVDNIVIKHSDIFITVLDMHRYANMLWSFIGGTTPIGWLKSDEANWDKAIDVIKESLRETDGFEELGDGKFRLKFVSNIAIATK